MSVQKSRASCEIADLTDDTATRRPTAIRAIYPGNRGTEAIFDGVDSGMARKACPQNLWKVARRKLDQVNRVKDLAELAVPPGNRLERLRSDRSGQLSIRINEQYRICFRWEAGDVYEVEITDYH